MELVLPVTGSVGWNRVKLEKISARVSSLFLVRLVLLVGAYTNRLHIIIWASRTSGVVENLKSYVLSLMSIEIIP